MGRIVNPAALAGAHRVERDVPVVYAALLSTKNPSLTQAKAALQAGLIRPEFADLVALIWAQVHLGSEASPW
ncbi:MAG: hypothetical protein ACK5RU_06195 [Hyphomonadaceae bacterium]|jgi:hypothetical protein